MTITHYIITRFSILDVNTTHFRLTNNNPKEEIKHLLFHPDRLDFKFDVFEKMTHPSIVGQTRTNYKWLIIASTFLPPDYKERLSAYQSDKIEIVYVDGFNQFKSYLNDLFASLDLNGPLYTTIRLDDDDGLCRTYLEDLESYAIECNRGKIVNFPNGIKFSIQDRAIVMGSPMHWKNNAAGLAAIGFNIYIAGAHISVSERYDVIYDNRKDAYFLCCSEHCDTKRKP